MTSNVHETISEKVVDVVSSAEGVSPTEIEPLYSTIDPDALERLFASTPNADRTVGHVKFPLEGYVVTVHADGRVSIAEQTT